MTGDLTSESSLEEALAYTREARELSRSNWDNCVPWRLLRWWRISREVVRRQRVLDEWRESR